MLVVLNVLLAFLANELQAQCVDGKYGIDCNEVCKPNCIMCSSSEICTACKNGYYSGTFMDLYSVYLSYSDCRYDCRPNCKMCTSYNYCGKCKAGYHGTICQNTCAKGCLNDNCNKKSGTCIDGCKLGFAGVQCDQCTTGKYGTDCDKDCISTTCAGVVCERSSGYCTSCGRYDYGNLCQNKCSTNCLYNGYCDIGGKCIYGCKNGYFGQTCQDECPSYCDKELEAICDSNGACSSCGNGRFGSYCENPCPETCSSCTSQILCSSCKAGNYGTVCEYTCPKTCMACTSQKSCSKCNTGYYGSNCSSVCPSKCKFGTKCNYDDGNCLGDCVHGKSGYYCNSDCLETCMSCQKNAYYKCTECIDGKYGYSTYNSYYLCNVDCPRNCRNKTCDGNNGNCVFGCTDGYEGDQCDCPTTCDTCSTNGTCAICKIGYENSQKKCQCRKDVCKTDSCDYCSNSTWYVDEGKQSCCPCSKNCKNNECTSEAECSQGCIQGKYGLACNNLCSENDINCIECTSENDVYSKCKQCSYGFYPDEVNRRCKRCKMYCKDNKCDSITGRCDECDEGYWGKRCEYPCPPGCLLCNRVNGTCDVCADGKYGINCSLNCSLNCKTSNGKVICAIQDGACKFGCSLKTVYGKMCEHECGEYCVDRECDWSTGECINCEINKYGPTCGITCDNNCLSDNTTTRCFQNNGSCTVGCQPGFYGDLCKKRCSKNCNNYTCERLSGDCHLGCNGDFTDTTCMQAVSDTDSSSNATLYAGIGGAIGMLVFNAVLFGAVMYIRNRSKRRHSPTNQEVSDIPITGMNQPNEGETSEYDNIGDIPQSGEYVNEEVAYNNVVGEVSRIFYDNYKVD